MKAFITGIFGFTGIHLVNLLKKRSIEVTGIDIHQSDYYQGDLKDKEKLTEIIFKEKPDYVFHLASPILRSDKLIDETLVKNLEVDLFGTVNLLEAINKLGNKPRVLITSTAAVYKQKKGEPFKETDDLEPRTAYGLSKLTQELVSLKLAEGYHIPLMISRSILLIGTQQAEGFVVNDLIKQVAMMELKLAKPMLEIGNINTTRDFMDVRDGVKGYLAIVEKGKAGEIYNVSSYKKTKIKEIVEWLKINNSVKFKVREKSKWRQNDLDVLVGDNRKLKSLGFKPQYKLGDSLSDILAYWRRELKA